MLAVTAGDAPADPPDQATDPRVLAGRLDAAALVTGWNGAALVVAGVSAAGALAVAVCRPRSDQMGALRRHQQRAELTTRGQRQRPGAATVTGCGRCRGGVGAGGGRTAGTRTQCSRRVRLPLRRRR